jgi:hypothetical protein
MVGRIEKKGVGCGERKRLVNDSRVAESHPI